MRDYWQNLQPREQLILLIGAVLLTLTLLYLLLEPFWQKTQLLQQQVGNQQIDLRWMEQAAVVLKGLRSAGQPQTTQSEPLLTVVDRTAKQQGLAEAIERIQPEGKRVQIRLKAAEFDAILRWIDLLNQQYGLLVDSLVLERQELVVGRVDARLVVGAE